MTDRDAIERIADELVEMFGGSGTAIARYDAERILDRLTADGYSVVKTGPAQALYEELRISAGIDQAFRNGYRRCLMEIIPSYRPGTVPDGEASEDA